MNEEQATSEKSPEPQGAAVSAVVGIGASAGGLEALESFFRQLPANTGAAYVVVTHQQAGRTSLLPDLLRKDMSMPVLETTKGLAIQPDCVYLSPPGYHLALLNSTLQVMDVPHAGRPVMPIDYFFRSLALDQKSKAVGIVLSGSGSDGSLGLTAIRGEGGLTMAQDPGSAKYAGMPASAIATGLVDFVLPVEQLPLQLVTCLSAPFPPRLEKAHEAEPLFSEALQQILILLRDRTRHDFSAYKKTSLRRRIERRMNLHQIANYPQYVRFLQENLQELDVLFKELLIGVTSFFRDPEAFSALSATLPGLLKARTDEDTVRAWVAGCSTGEEAYTVAMCLLACREQLGRRFRVQVFATDLDKVAIDFARRAVYPEGIASDVGSPYLEKCFVHTDRGYQVKKEVRETVVFAVNNILSDPPFHGLDLVSCRNLLIYLENEPQERLVAVFQHALRSGGVLLLGSSESLGSAADLFTPLNKKWKLFERSAVAHVPAALARTSPGWPIHTGQPLGQPSWSGKPKGPADFTALLGQVLLERYGPPSAIVHESGEILAIHGRTGAFLEPTPGKPSMNILAMAREGLRTELLLGIRQAMSQNQEVLRQGISVKSNGEYTVVDLAVVRLQQPEAVRGMLLIAIRPVRTEVPAPPSADATTPPPATSREESLERELLESKASLQNTIERLENANEALTSTNEELQSTNEEAQSVNEELQTTKEEMHSLNEELQTVNSELEAKLTELSRAHDDMINLMNGTDIATLFLDARFRITRFTPLIKRIINLIPTDIGRPISDISVNLEYSGLLEDCEQVLAGLVPKVVEVRTTEGAWYLMRISIYRTADNVIAGVVVTFSDITRLKTALEEKEIAEILMETIREPFLVLDESLQVIRVNRAFLRLFLVPLEEIVGRRVYDLGDGQWNIPPLRTLLEQILPENSTFADFKVEHDFPNIGKRTMLLNARRAQQLSTQRGLIFLAFEDISSKVRSG